MFCTTSETEDEAVHVKLVESTPVIHYGPFQGGSSVVFLLHVFGVSVSVTFHLTCVHIILVRFRLLSGHLLRNSCSFG